MSDVTIEKIKNFALLDLIDEIKELKISSVKNFASGRLGSPNNSWNFRV